MAYADFVTAMMAFFLLMWLLNATTEEQRKGLADYFSPNSVLSHNSSGTGQPFGGRTAFSDGAMLSDLGSPQVTVGQQPVVDQVEDDESDVIVQPRPHRDDTEKQGTGSGRQTAAEAAAATGAERRSGRAASRRRGHGGARRCATHGRPRRSCARNWRSAKSRPSSRRRSRSAKPCATIRNWPSWRANWRST